MKVTFDHAEQLTPHIVTFWFKPERPVNYIAGQFTEIHLPHDADDRGIRRWFTLSSSPTQPLVSITTKFTPGRSSTFKQLLQTMQPGTMMDLADPMGDFVLPKDPTIPLIFVAGGMGITPIHSMIAWLTDQQQARRIHLIYAVNSIDDLVFVNLFTNYNLTFTPVIKKPPADYNGETGTLDAARILQLSGTPDDALYFLAGPELMVETITKAMIANGLPAANIATDYFPGYTQA